MYFSKKVYAVYNGVRGKAPEAGEFSRIFVLKATCKLITEKIAEQDVLVAPPVILLGSNCSPLLPGSRAYEMMSIGGEGDITFGFTFAFTFTAGEQGNHSHLTTAATVASTPSPKKV